jgi:hypothetical protein
MMKNLSVIVFFILLCQVNVDGQHADFINNREYIQKNRIIKVKETFKNAEDKTRVMTEVNFYKFDSNGHRVMGVFDKIQAFGDKILDDRIHTWDSIGTQNQVVLREFYKGKIYQYTEYYRYDRTGLLSASLIWYQNKFFLKDSTLYDQRGNDIEVFLGDWYTDSNCDNRWLKTYDQSNRLMSVRAYAKYSNPTKFDTFIYNSQGQLTAKYGYDMIDGSFVMVRKYIAQYDESGKMLTEVDYRGRAMGPGNDFHYKYDAKGQMIEKYGFNRDIPEYRSFRETYLYNENGLLIEERFYDTRYKNEPDLVFTWKYKYDFY